LTQLPHLSPLQKRSSSSWGIFHKGTNKVAWICEHWTHEQHGLQITVNHCFSRTIGDAKIFIDNELIVDDGQILVFAASPEEAREDIKDILSKPKPPVLPPTFPDDYPAELIG
jgi:hypothetical protein